MKHGSITIKSGASRDVKELTDLHNRTYLTRASPPETKLHEGASLCKNQLPVMADNAPQSVVSLHEIKGVVTKFMRMSFPLEFRIAARFRSCIIVGCSCRPGRFGIRAAAGAGLILRLSLYLRDDCCEVALFPDRGIL